MIKAPVLALLATTVVVMTTSCQGTRPLRPSNKTTATPTTSSSPKVDAGVEHEHVASNDVRVSVGSTFACSVSKGHVLCWGSGAQGALGDGAVRSSAVPVRVQGIDDAIDVTASAYAHACALHRDGGVSCWGVNDSGQLGDGTRDERHTPIRVPGLTNVRQISAGTSHTCVVLADATVRCWGRNHMAQLGDGTWDDRVSPIIVPGVRAVRIAAGANRTCALVEQGGQGGQGGQGRDAPIATPQDENRPVMCWGGTHRGGSGPSGPNVSPAIVSALPHGTVLGVSSSFDLACVLSKGEIHCLPGGVPYAKPGETLGIKDAIDLSIGGTGGCALRGAARSVSCWDYRFVPEPVPNLATADRLAQGNGWGCAVRANGRVACWGNAGEGQLGDGSVQRVLEPVRVRGLDGAVDGLAIGSHHTCAKTGTSVRCWGLNRNGALGDGTTIDRASAIASVDAAPFDASAQLIGGQGITCTLHKSLLRCWGGKESTTSPPPSSSVLADAAPAEERTTQRKDVLKAAAHGFVFCIAEKSRVACAKETGDPTRSVREVPGMGAGAGIEQLAVSTLGVCALRNGSVTCAGFKYEGPIRSQPALMSEKATVVPGIADAVEIALVGYHLIARLRNGTVVGLAVGGDKNGDESKPSPRGGGLLTDVVAIAPFGDQRFCAVRANGAALCAASYKSEQEPPQTFNIGASRTIAGGPNHVCVALKAGGAMCWGDSTYGQVGAGTFGYRAAAGDVALP